MGHTLPPFSQQFKLERAMFAEMRRALLLRDDKAFFDDLWDKAEFHVPAAEKAKHPLPITSMLLSMNLEQEKQALIKDELTYHSYGQVHYRAAQTLLYGRWHIDPGNAAMSGGFSLSAAIEMARVSGVDVQIAARNSPGAGFTAMQIRQALRWGVLVPQEKRQTEPFRPLMALGAVCLGRAGRDVCLANQRTHA